MNYWAMARGAGMDESEFWTSTPARVFALVDRQDERDKRRDYFVAHLIALKHNSLIKKEDKALTSLDILAWRYPNKPQDVVTTFNDSLGAEAVGFDEMRPKAIYGS